MSGGFRIPLTRSCLLLTATESPTASNIDVMSGNRGFQGFPQLRMQLGHKDSCQVNTEDIPTPPEDCQAINVSVYQDADGAVEIDISSLCRQFILQAHHE
ncbi:hypothetical protein NPIL_363671 [Nephila pilipes]|uniref:Uncharacterized protein n=1 Tax=Nephila pilipes TaxID=299642 RepID=A0A8X6NDT6_NEPPI|nr:hypothetical protein NPIL_363671 [Nephila pilipes]